MAKDATILVSEEIAKRRAGLAARKAGLSPQKQAEFTLLVNNGSDRSRTAITIPHRSQAGAAPLSFAQERLWFLYQMEPEKSVYNIPMVLRLDGPLNAPAMEQALREIVRRHESLRTRFVSQNGTAVQEILGTLDFELQSIDLRDVARSARSEEAQRMALVVAQQPFQLEHGPVMRFSLFQIDIQEYLLVLVLHHIVSDGWSLQVLMEEVSDLYNFFCGGQPSRLLEPAVQYADYAEWQRERLSGELLQSEISHWKEQLHGIPAMLALPTDFRRPAEMTFRGETQWVVVPAKLNQELKKLGQAEGATLFMTLLASFQLLLSRYSGQEDVLVGTPVAGRTQVELERLIGFFANTLVLRTKFSQSLTFRQLLGQARETVLAAQAHQEMPFEKLVEELRLERSLSYSPLFQVMFIFNNVPKRAMQANGLLLRELEFDAGIEKFDLTLSVSEGPEGLSCTFSYSTDLFSESTIKRMIDHWLQVLETVTANPECRTTEVPLLTPPERRQFEHWNQTSCELPISGCFQQQFSRQAARTPDAIAVTCGEENTTYRELEARATRLTEQLRSKAVGPETVVGLLVPRSTELLTAMLAVFKAGAAYLPLDPNHPSPRHLLVLKQAQVRHVITTREAAPDLKGYEDTGEILCVEEITLEKDPKPELPEIGSTGNLAYVIYTSGSSGVPKGAMVEQRGMLNHLYAKLQDLNINSADSIAQTASQSFDISVWQFLAPLLAGGKVAVVPDAVVTDPQQLFGYLSKNAITIAEVVPSMLRAFLEEVDQGRLQAPELASLRWLLVTGEALPPELIGRWSARYPAINLLNAYGPTECSDDVTHQPLIDSPWQEWVHTPIGRPIINTQLYVLDERLEPVPVGLAGELFIGGLCLGRGYLYDPALTAQAFVPNTVGDQAGSRFYRTGDIVRWKADGSAEFLGRRDEQVKLRGNRIELGEIEAVLREHENIQDTAVIAVEGDNEEARLIAFVVPGKARPVNSQLQKFLREKLPDYMVPSIFVQLDELPLTDTGKVDRRKLRKLAGISSAPGSGTALIRGMMEDTLAEVWKQLLQLERVDRTANFFWLGGHSLLATQVVARVREIFKVDLPVRAVFESPVLSELAERIDAARRKQSGAQAPPLQPASGEGRNALSFAQQRLWFLDQLNPNSNAYNVPVSARLEMKLNVRALEDAVSETVRRHETLRTTFSSVEGQPIQVISPPAKIGLQIVDLNGLEEAERDVEVQKLARDEALRRFDLATGPLLRVCLLRLGGESHVELLTLHHIITDGWSMGVLMQEVESSYRAFLSGTPSELPLLPVQYADFALWQRNWMERDLLKLQLGYWKRQLAGAPMLLGLATDFPRPAKRTLPGMQCPITFPESLSKRLRELCRREGTTLFMMLAAAFQVLLGRYTAQNEVLLGTPAAGRGQVEVENLIGFFVNMIVLKADLRGVRTIRELLRQVRETALDAYAHQDVPFDKLVEELKPERRPNRNPIFQAILAFQNAPTPGMEMAGVTLPSGSPGSADTKFDLELYFWENGIEVAGSFVFSPELFRPRTIARMASQFLHLLETFVSRPDSSLSELSLVTDSEYRQITEIWNRTDVEFPDQAGIHEVFVRQVQLTPDAIALETEREQISYQELDQRSTAVAAYLQSLGVGQEVFVGILIERSPEMVLAILATLKAGGVYVPLNTGDPARRIEFILQDAGISVLLTSSQIAEKLPPGRVTVVCLDSPADQDRILATQAGNSAGPPAAAENLAYMIYTSGSTGIPKGVCITHRNVLRLVKGASYVDLTSREVFLQFAPISFDASTFEIWGALLNGARLVVFPPAAPSLRDLGDFIHKSQITTMWLTAGLFHQMVDKNPEGIAPVRQLLAGGEALSVKHVNKLLTEAPDCSLVNGYGPTESTTFACCCNIGGNLKGTTVPIGSPIGNTKVYVLNDEMRLAAIGEMGELYIGGAGLARGYLNRADLTAERFGPDPFSKSGQRLYRTGDLVRYLEDGNIEFLGRKDKQIKLRGFRIELEEIEVTLAAHPLVKQAVVIPRDDSAGGKRLVAYIVPSPGSTVTVEMLRSHAQERLPEYMVPWLFLVLEQLPLTPNGKIDANALLSFDRLAARPERTFVAPKDRLQEQLITIWEGLLDARPIGIQDDFFELGGHSLIAVQLIARIEQETGKRLPMAALFEGATIGRLSQLLRDETGTTGTSSSLLAPIQPNGTRPPIFCVHAAGGTVFCYTDLAKHLGQDQPVYGIQAPASPDTAVQTIEALASEYVKAVQGFQPRGPYFLGGWSMGGLIAFEIARQLAQQGEKIALLFLVDAQAPSGESAEYNWVILLGSFAVDLGIPFDYLKSSSDEIFSRPPMEQLRRIWSDAKRFKLITSDMTLADFRKLFDRFKASAQMAKSYAGARYPGKITFFRAHEPEEYVGKARPKKFTVELDPTRGWKKWAGQGVEVHTVPGQHFTVMREPYVAGLAEALRTCSEKAAKEN